MSGDICALSVLVYRGEVRVGGALIAGRSGWWSLSIERVMEPLRERTSPDWWRWAYEIIEAEQVGNTGGPLGAGVDFFADEMGEAVPPEVRALIEHDAYEAARDAILAGLDSHTRQMATVLGRMVAS